MSSHESKTDGGRFLADGLVATLHESLAGHAAVPVQPRSRAFAWEVEEDEDEGGDDDEEEDEGGFDSSGPVRCEWAFRKTWKVLDTQSCCSRESGRATGQFSELAGEMEEIWRKCALAYVPHPKP